jgi:hypothetical protein
MLGDELVGMSELLAASWRANGRERCDAATIRIFLYVFYLENRFSRSLLENGERGS